MVIFMNMKHAGVNLHGVCVRGVQRQQVSHSSFCLLGNTQHIDLGPRILLLMGLRCGEYVSFGDLRSLASSSSTPAVSSRIGGRSCPSPIVLEVLARFLTFFPDQRLVTYVLDGIQHGFRIGVSGMGQLRPVSRNHPSSASNPAVVSAYISAERAAGRLLGPLPSSPSVHVSPIGLVPKGHGGDAWRMIVDLSYPRGRSVNDFIDPSICSPTYPSIDDAVAVILALGRGTELVKIDLKNAYRILPIHPDDRQFLGIAWEGHVYIDQCLPFGLRSAPKIFSAFADVLAWVLHSRGVRYLLHYLDDFLLFGPPRSGEGRRFLHIALSTLAALGIPVSMSKLEGPSTSVTFLGIVVDTARFELRLPEDKLSRIRALVTTWIRRRSGRRSDIESLLGHLSHAAIVVRPGRIFLRHLFSLMARVAQRHHFVHLDRVVKADLAWWDCFLQSWHGSSFIIPDGPASIQIHSDASGSFGCGAFTSDLQWLQLQWPGSWAHVDISVKEMVPIVLAAALWGDSWRGSRVCFLSDNAAVVAVLNCHSPRHPILLHLLRCLYFYSAHYQFSYCASHLPGVLNTAADALSRDNMTLFLSLVPQGCQSQVPWEMVELLITCQPDWGSGSWISLFKATLAMHSPSHPGGVIGQQ